MQIESIELKNYRLFRHAKITALPSMVTLVGANGSGKSTLFDVLSFLKDALTRDVAHAVRAPRGIRGIGEPWRERPDRDRDHFPQERRGFSVVHA